MKNREKFRRIGPNPGELETGGVGERAESRNSVFVGEFRDNFFADVEMEFVPAKMHGLRPLADEMHFDTVRIVIINGPMSPLRRLEIRIQFAVRALQDVEIERRGNPCAVVVGGFQNLA